MRNRKTEPAGEIKSPCDIYLAMIKNPPQGRQIVCKDVINYPLLAITGEVYFEQECQVKTRLEHQFESCKSSLGSNSLFSDGNETNHPNNTPKLAASRKYRL